ncbi:MAG: formimidoylglutamate deiminase [Acidimicrobiia bacterium]
MTSFWCQLAWIGGQAVESVAIDAGDDGKITAVEVGVEPGNRHRLSGLVYPGFANAHSHAFHRSLRGKAQAGQDFWAWREEMYRVADGLDPDSYLQLATKVYTEMVLAGFTAVGEFHYLHHQPGGEPYADPNAMGEALRQAATAAGIRLTLLDTCYLEGGIGADLSPTQRRFSDGSVEGWRERMAMLQPDPNTRIGAAIHSVRAVNPDDLPKVVAATSRTPLHIHVSEQAGENEASQAAYGLSSLAVLERAGVLGPLTTAVHAIHVSDEDLTSLSSSGTTVCACPTTEADLGDGIGPFAAMASAGIPLVVGTDQHVLIDPFEEVRRLEMDQRLATGVRGHFEVSQLVDALCAEGYRSIGWDDGGRIAVGAWCDLVTVRTNTARTDGVHPDWLLIAAGTREVAEVIVGGRTIARDGIPSLIG